IEVDDPAVAHLAGELACIVAAVTVVPAAVVVVPATAPVAVVGVYREAAFHRVTVALAVDVADVGHLGVAAAIRIAARIALGRIDALLDGLARAARAVVVAAVVAVTPVVAAAFVNVTVVVAAVAAGGRGHC